MNSAVNRTSNTWLDSNVFATNSIQYFHGRDPQPVPDELGINFIISFANLDDDDNREVIFLVLRCLFFLIAIHFCLYRYTYSQWLYLGQTKRSTIFPGHNFRERYPKYSSSFYLNFYSKNAFSTNGRFFVTGDDSDAAFEISFNYDANNIQFDRIDTFGIKIAQKILNLDYFVESNNVSDPNEFPLYSLK